MAATIGAASYGPIPTGGTVGQLLVKNSAAYGDANWVTAPASGGVGFTYQANGWYANTANVQQTTNLPYTTISANTTTYVPMYVPFACTVNAMGCWALNTPGKVNIGMNIANPANAYKPGALIGSAVMTISTAGWNTVSAGWKVAAGWIYLGVGCTSSGPYLQTYGQSKNVVVAVSGYSTPTNTAAPVEYLASSTAGALTSNPTVASVNKSSATILWFQAA